MSSLIKLTKLLRIKNKDLKSKIKYVVQKRLYIVQNKVVNFNHVNVVNHNKQVLGY